MTASSVVLEALPQCCPQCGREVRSAPPNVSAAGECPCCRKPLWFLRKSYRDVMILTFLAEGEGGIPSHGWTDAVVEVIAEARRVVVDLGRLQTVSSLFLGMLIAVQRRLKACNGVVSLCGLQPEVAYVVKLTHLNTLFEIYSDGPAAIGGFSNGRDAS